MTPSESLAAANLGFYAIVSLPALYCFIMHGKHGLAAWVYVLAMCGLRLAGNAISLHAYEHNQVSTVAAIINGIGLSPLLIAAMGLLRESNHSIQQSLSSPLNTWGFLIAHIVIGGGIGLAAASKANETILKVGMIFFATGWTMVCGLVVLSYQATSHRQRLSDERKILLAVTIAMPLIGIRIIYAIATVFSSSGLEGGSLAVRVIFGTLPEYLTMLVYIGVGIATRNLARSRLEPAEKSQSSGVGA
ncbi:hypothetical protein BO70DRAFT_357409 [Aspergillus heteromorphus CBS 117.55]|uniref:DUF7702 domain-containing protein n=1 Tax=Aspergillus heteromorphus CBS 117.55 TaxID=1448321 RepID=A0A317X441_9EURO|nr:uncharacterized protein BO70DRAFT_357409 [Aspergillus heteromorphus CBS 117.55]PWY92277.1 hypothetical protein BO70DRAFT_357409 [Aspergillus heteromorphus CBS 117.55]